MNAEERLEICKKCGLARHTEFGIKCDDRKWLDVANNTTSFFKKDGWVKGCGCNCAIRVKNPNNHCVANKW